ncbi:HNH endonuclease [Staphylococcus casei]|uniref:Putative HNH nuclease YajD n=1 Tax=Staphylococcus casei TaxID=201828 RepID=A0ABZ2W9V8_9STAP
MKKESEIDLTFKVPKVRLGNKTYKDSELQEYRRANTRRYNTSIREGIDKEYTAFYHSSEWRKCRVQVLIRDSYLCQHCLKRGIVNDKDLFVHHIVELKRDWNRRLDMGNLETVCRTCHNSL